MSLIPCKTCNEQISADAYDCPKCGAAMKTPKRGIFGKIFLFYGYNALMVWWLFSVMAKIGEIVTEADMNDSAVAIGTGIGAGALHSL